MIGIYAIENLVNGKKYIGQSIDVENRLIRHRSLLKHNRHENSHLQHSWNKYGEENFKFYPLEECSEEELDSREIYYIAKYNSFKEEYGYNVELGGSKQKKLNEAARKRMSEKMKGKYSGDKNPMYGVHLKHSEEYKKKLSEKMTGKGNPMYGIHLTPSDEQRKIASERFSGEGNPFYGHKHTQEVKEKMRKNNKKKKPIRCIETGVIYESSCEAQRQLGLDASHINACCNGKQKTSGGFHWEFVA